MQPLKHTPTYDAAGAGEPLRRALARLNADPVDYLDAPLQDIDQVWDAVLREIDETVLPRRFALSNASGVLAHLSITSRRLVAVDLPSHSTKSDTAPPSTQFAKLITRACRADGPFALRQTGRDGTISEGGQSCTVDDLRHAVTGLPSGMPLHTFFQQIEPTAQTWLLFQDGACEPRHGGDARHYEMLAELAAKTRRDAAGRIGLTTKPTCTILPLNETHCIALASDQNAILLAVLSHEYTQAATIHWSAHYV